MCFAPIRAILCPSAAKNTDVIEISLPAYTISTLHKIVSRSPVETSVETIEIDLTSRPYALSVDEVASMI